MSESDDKNDDQTTCEPSRGQVAYDAYRASLSDVRDVDPPWEILRERYRKAWVSAAYAAVCKAPEVELVHGPEGSGVPAHVLRGDDLEASRAKIRDGLAAASKALHPLTSLLYPDEDDGDDDLDQPFTGKLRPGDIVTLKSGGEEMTVNGELTGQPPRFRCQWFDGGQLQTAIIPAASLTVSPRTRDK